MSVRRFTLFMLLLIAILSLSLLVLAQAGGEYDLSWNTVDGGGYTSSEGGGYSLGGTIGQADTGMLSGGSYTLGGGFWGEGEVAAHESRICLPLVLQAVH